MTDILVFIKKSLLLSLVLMFSTAQAANDKSAEQVISALNPVNIASGTFVQRKYFNVLKQPIISQGEIHFEKDLGLLWQTNKPIHSQMLLKNSGLYSDDGINPIKKIKGAGAVASAMMSTMMGDTETILQEFEIKSTSKNHCVNLIPNDVQLSKIINAIELCSKTAKLNSNTKQNNILDYVILHEKSGNRTEIQLQFNSVNVLSEEIRAQLQ